MTKRKSDETKKSNTTPPDVEPGSDADTTPVPEVGKTPPNPNEKR